MNDAVPLSAAARRFGLVSQPPASLDVRPCARNISHEKDKKTTNIIANTIDLCQLFNNDLDSWPVSPAQLMFARDLENIDALTKTSTNALKEIDEEKNKTIHLTLLLPSLGDLVLPSHAPFNVRPWDPVDISCNNRRSPIAERGREVGR